MDLPLEETIKRKDYSLKYRFNYCTTCEYEGKDPNVMTNIFIHTFKNENHNINQYHGQLGSKHCHITKPMKYCTKCNKTYRYDEYICVDCQNLVDARTTQELIIEECVKNISRTQRLRSRGKYTAVEAKTRVTILEKSKREAIRKLDNLSKV